MADASACGNFNVIPGISYFTAAASTVLAISTTLSHILILHAIIKDRKKKFKLFFYKLLLNISIADLLCGVFNDPYSVVFHTQEGLLQTPIDIRVFHVSLYLLGSVPLFTMVALALDRILALMKTSKYRNGLQGKTSWSVLLAIWLLSTLQILAYFKLGFIPYLIVFAAVNIAIAVIAMLITYLIYRKYLGRNVSRGKSTPDANTSTSDNPSRRRQEREKRATRTFLISTVVIVLSYLPTCFATGYMNSCTNCNCAIVHSLRDIAIVSILAGSLFRAINFLVCLKSLRPSLGVFQALVKKAVEYAGRPQDIFTAGKITRGFKDIAFADYGKRWQQLRKLAHTSLKLYGVGMEKMEDFIQEEADDLCERIKGLGSKPVDPHKDFALAIINIICSLVFGKRYEKDDPEFLNVVQYNTLITQGFSHTRAVAFLSWLRFFPNEGYEKIDKGITIRDAILRRQLQYHKETFDPENIRDLTDALISEASKEEFEDLKDRKFPTNDHIEMILHDAFTAGSETTTTAIRWANLLLVRNPTAQDKAADELARVVGHERNPCLNDRDQLHYIRAVINEVLRISSVIPLGVPHKTTCNTTLAGHYIAKDTQILFNNWAIHHDERFWEDPYDFKPERWINEEGNFVADRYLSFLPFSAGRRVCLGEILARTEIYIFLTRILHQFRIEKVPGEGLPPQSSNRSVIHSPKPFRVVYVPRRKAK